MKKTTFEQNRGKSRIGKETILSALSLAIVVLILIPALCACASGAAPVSSEKTSGETSSPAETNETPAGETTKTEETTLQPDSSAEKGVGDFGISTEDGKVTQDGTVFTISSAGTYLLSGSLAEGRVIVDAGDSDEVELDLNGVSITCSTDAPIYVKNADKVKIKAMEGTENTVNDTRPLRTDENDAAPSAAIYALCDMNFVGSGKLTVASSYNNGIQTKDDLKIKNQTLCVTAPNNAVKGNDSVTIESGTITVISTSGDGIKTDNSDVSSKGNQRGTVSVSGGTILIYAAGDGIDAAYDVEISGDPSITIYTHSYSSYTLQSAKKTSTSNGVTKSADSAKGIKADNEVTISGGTIGIQCMDDGIHANSDVALENGKTPLGNITIGGGSITITAADDGIHADGTLLIRGGYVDVVDSHEGLEGHYVIVKDGEIHVYATDDGVNATSSGNRVSDGQITVSGGKMFVEVAGRDVDGIDANGNYTQTGGFVVVSNPNADASGNMSAVDTDGSVSVTGGVIIALGTVPGGGGMPGGGMPGGRGRFGMGGMTGASSLPSGYVTISGTLSKGEHTFTYGEWTETFTLRSSVSGGWIWADGITSGNYTLK